MNREFMLVFANDDELRDRHVSYEWLKSWLEKFSNPKYNSAECLSFLDMSVLNEFIFHNGFERTMIVRVE